MNKNGFTLMELLVVVIIIGGLAAMTYPAYRTSVEHARASEAVNMVATIQAAQQKHFINYDEYGDIFKDINDFVPSIEDFDDTRDSFSTDYFEYTLGRTYYEKTCVEARRVGAATGYKIIGCYADNFIRCKIDNNSEDGKKICSSLTDRPMEGSGSTAYYPIY
ncbi:MAG: prepilin-type N-terminal cleavage/methylation domain-containing protein [Elusimicrobiaceae bacterium]|nr:prepilin-type N-terminal cleavage/methylation domain-containing protein [Elusimicrobiaceae bacterium]